MPPINRGIKVLLFGSYSYLFNILFSLLEMAPQFIRNIVFIFLFKKFGRGCHIDYKTYFRYTKKITIGDDVSINRGCAFYASYFIKEAYIKIGNNVSIGPQVTFFSAGHDYKYIDRPDIGGSIIVDDNVWIGGRSVILPGVTVGRGAVVGAGSVVTKDVSPWTIVAGNPAKLIKQRVLTD